MKKAREYVSRGVSSTPSPRPEAPPEGEVPRRLTSDLPPSLLPRDYGMAGRVGAYEVRRLARALPEALRLLEAIPDASPLTAVEAALNRLLSPEERARVTVESLTQGKLTLVCARRSDRFTYSRTLVPRLCAALEPALGRLFVTLKVAPKGLE